LFELICFEGLTPMSEAPRDTHAADTLSLPCVLCFNALDPSGAGGLSADILAMSSASTHVLPVACAILIRDTSEVHDHHAVDDETVTDQARCILEDAAVAAFKIGFLGSTENVSAVAQITSDYADIPVVAYMPELAWMDEIAIENYLDAFNDLLLPQVTILMGNHATLCRWLLADWEGQHPPGPRDIARAAAEQGVAYTVVTGIQGADQWLENHLASPETVLASARFERFEARFTGAGETLSAALTALLAAGADLQTACAEALNYLDQALDGGFQPGMGHAIPDRLFWAESEDPSDDNDDDDDAQDPNPNLLDFPVDSTRH
jgi:hydroxymethylpyrimidine/phosphomethylpyrimidine kinase